MDEVLLEAISNWSYTPFNPAPILHNFTIENNVLKIEEFHSYLSNLRTTRITKLDCDFSYYRSGIMNGMLQLFNAQARNRWDV